MEFNEFLKKANEAYKLIPIIKEIESFDREAIDIYSNHFDEKKSFFFESLEGDKNWSRYTIIGCSSGDFIEIYGDNEIISEEFSSDLNSIDESIKIVVDNIIKKGGLKLLDENY